MAFLSDFSIVMHDLDGMPQNVPAPAVGSRLDEGWTLPDEDDEGA